MPPPPPRRGGPAGAAAGRLAAPPFAPASVNASAGALAKVVAAGRTSGVLQLSARGLSEVPAAVYDPEAAAAAAGGGAWWEAAELTRLDLSRNEIRELPPDVFGPTCATLTSLDVSQNRLRRLPPGLGALSELRSLSVSGNPLGGAAAGAGAAGAAARGRGGLAALGAARAGGGGAAGAAGDDDAGPGGGLPDDTARLPQLASLACADCGLESLPDGLGDAARQPALAQLLAGGNRLARLPAGLAGAGALVRLELQGNRLSELDGRVVAGWASLQELDVSENDLQALPPELGLLTRLRTLRARRNRLAALPPALAGCSSLVELHAGFNAVRALPEALGTLRALAVLELRNNHITDFPASLCGLPLTLLDLTANSLRALPPELGLMTTLRSVPLDGNPLKLIRRELWAGPVSALLEFLRSRLPDPATGPSGADAAPLTAAGLARARSGGAGASGGGAAGGGALGAAGGGELVLYGKGLASLPPELSDPSAADVLVRLDLGGNPALGAALRGRPLPPMARLRALGLGGSGAGEWPLPAGGGEMPALQTLDLRGNPLQHLPPGGLRCCPELRTLDLSSNPAAAVAGMPALFLAPAPKLEVISLANCRLAAAPWDALRRVAGSLRRLDLSGNSLAELPPFVCEFKRLEELDLTNNALTSLPPELGLLSSSRGGRLRALMVQGNCIRAIRRPLLEGGAGALLDYLASRLPDA